MYTEYYAPRGRRRLMELGNTITSQYLSPEDHCVGILERPAAANPSSCGECSPVFS